MTVLWAILWAASWLAFGVGTVWTLTTSRRVTWESALLLRAVLTLLLLIAGVIFMMLTAQPTHY